MLFIFMVCILVHGDELDLKWLITSRVIDLLISNHKEIKKDEEKERERERVCKGENI